MARLAQGNESGLFRAVRLFVLMAGGVLAGAVQLAILPAMTQMAAHFSENGGDGAFIAQNVTTIAAPVMAFGAPLIGWLAGILGKRKVLLAAAVIYGAAGIAGAAAPDLWTLLASRLILGLAAAGYVTIAVALVGDYYAGEARDKLIGWFSVVGGGGTMLVLFAAGKLTEFGGWHAPFFLYLAGFPLAILAFFTVFEVPRAAAASVASARSDSVRGAAGIFVLVILISIVMYAVTIQGTFLMASEGIVNPSTQSNILLLATVGSMAGAYLFGLIRPRLGFHLVLALVWAALAIGTIGFASTPNVFLLALFAGLAGMGSGLMQPLTQSAVLNILSPAAAARGVGLAVGCIFLGQFLNPYVLSPLRAAFGVQGAFVAAGAAAALGAALAVIWRLRIGLRPARAGL
jgi:MFS family permease